MEQTNDRTGVETRLEQKLEQTPTWELSIMLHLWYFVREIEIANRLINYQNNP